MAADVIAGPYAIALIGAGSAVAGGAITAMPGWLSHRAARRAEEEDRRRLVRQAARLVLEELSEIQRTIDSAARSQVTWRTTEPLPHSEWDSNREILAGHVRQDTWRWLAAAYRDAAAANHWVENFNSRHGVDGPTYFSDLDWLHLPHQTVMQAMINLECEGDPDGCAFALTGHVSAEEIEAGWPDGTNPGSRP